MRKRYFEIVCDKCGIAINHYPIKSPTNKQLDEDGVYRRGKKHYCDDCVAKLNWARLTQKTGNSSGVKDVV